jgi:hypothetical protein
VTGFHAQARERFSNKRRLHFLEGVFGAGASFDRISSEWKTIASQRPLASAQLGRATECINCSNNATKPLTVIVPANDRSSHTARPLNINLGFLVSMHGIQEDQRRRWAVIGSIELPLLHSHLTLSDPSRRGKIEPARSVSNAVRGTTPTDSDGSYRP